jgi:hypothetical protein
VVPSVGSCRPEAGCAGEPSRSPVVVWVVGIAVRGQPSVAIVQNAVQRVSSRAKPGWSSSRR